MEWCEETDAAVWWPEQYSHISALHNPQWRDNRKARGKEKLTMSQIKDNMIYSLHFIHWNHSELRYKSIAIQLFMGLGTPNLWNTRDSIVGFLTDLLLVHYFLVT